LLQVKSWQDHAAKYLRENMELQATNAALGASARHQRARLEEIAAAEAEANGAPLKPRERYALQHELESARLEIAKLKKRCLTIEETNKLPHARRAQ
jgi:hypothetical protein